MDELMLHILMGDAIPVESKFLSSSRWKRGWCGVLTQ